MRSKRFVDLTMDEMLYLAAKAAKAALPEALVRDVVTETVERFHQVWGDEQDHLPISVDLKKEINRLLSVIPLARG